MSSGFFNRIKTVLRRWGLMSLQERRQFIIRFKGLLPQELRSKIILELDVGSMVPFCESIDNILPDECDPLWRIKYQELYGKEKDKLYSQLPWKDNLLRMGVYGFGSNREGQLGLSRISENEPTPQRIPDERFRLNRKNAKIIQVSARGDPRHRDKGYTMCLDENGNVWAFGNNDTLQLGLGFGYGINGVNEPQRVKDLPRITQVSTGRGYTVCLDGNGDVWGFGVNEYGRLGTTDYVVDKPQRIKLLPQNITKVSAGNTHTVCIDENKNVWTFGKNKFGQLGLGYTSERVTKPQQVLDLSRITQVSTGDEYTVCLDEDGNIWGFGENNSGQLGLGLDSERIVHTPRQIPDKLLSTKIIQISTCFQHTVCLDENGHMWSFGHSPTGALGLGSGFDFIESLKPQQIDPSFFRVDEQSVRITQVSAGGSYTVCIDEKGNVWGFGGNADGQLGLGTDQRGYFTPQLMPYNKAVEVSAGGRHTMLIGF